MLESLRRVLGGVVGVVVLGVAVGSCTEDNAQSIFIRQVQAPAAGQCEYKADATQPAYLHGYLDLSYRSEFASVLLVGNQLVKQGSSELARSESDRVVLETADVSVEIPGMGLLDSYTQSVTGFVDPGSGSDPGWGLATVIMVSQKASVGMAKLLGVNPAAPERLGTVGRAVSRVVLKGKTLAGDEMETQAFAYPIDFCFGCLTYYPKDAEEATLPTPNCKKSGVSFTAPCVIGQNEPVHCLACKSVFPNDPFGLCEP